MNKTSFRYGEYKYHLVMTFEDNGNTFYVVKFFGRYKQWWHYELWDEITYKSRTT